MNMKATWYEVYWCSSSWKTWTIFWIHLAF